MAEKSMNHFLLARFREPFWQLTALQRGTFFTRLESDLRAKLPADLREAVCFYFYQVSPLRSDADFLLWSAAPADEENEITGFFEGLGQVLNARRLLLEPVQALWGFTKPSQYARGASAQEIDPFQETRKPYLIVYPFVKTAEWYLLSRDTRQGMMNQHIRIGHQYPEIKQLLLYSFGLQDQEFVVVYEADQMGQFSDLVNELRGSEARRYTERDTPNFTAIWRSSQDLGKLYAGEQG